MGTVGRTGFPFIPPDGFLAGSQWGLFLRKDLITLRARYDARWGPDNLTGFPWIFRYWLTRSCGSQDLADLRVCEGDKLTTMKQKIRFNDITVNFITGAVVFS